MTFRFAACPDNDTKLLGPSGTDSPLDAPFDTPPEPPIALPPPPFPAPPMDPVVTGLVVLTLGGIALAACCLPARRATQVDPVTILSQQ